MGLQVCLAEGEAGAGECITIRFPPFSSLLFLLRGSWGSRGDVDLG
jgi:hypothetical protein